MKYDIGSHGNIQHADFKKKRDFKMERADLRKSVLN